MTSHPIPSTHATKTLFPLQSNREQAYPFSFLPVGSLNLVRSTHFTTKLQHVAPRPQYVDPRLQPAEPTDVGIACRVRFRWLTNAYFCRLGSADLTG